MGEPLIFAGMLIYMVGWAGSIRLAFKESTYLGFWVLFVPFVWLYFLFTRIEITVRWALVTLVGLLVLVAGIMIEQSSM